MNDDWALWEKENCWLTEDDWRKRARAIVSEGEEQLYRMSLERRRRRGKDGDDSSRE